MDIHPHSGPIRSIREYLVHLSMVVLGILIALALEQWRTAREDHAIARRALDDMKSEIMQNRAELAKATAELEQIAPRIDQLSKLQKQAIEAQLKHAAPPAEPAPESNGIDFPVFSSAAWDGALAMQALGKIDPETARRVARIYSKQRDVKDAQRSFIGVAAHFDTMGGRTLNDTSERMRERYGALQEVRTWMTILAGEYHSLLKEYGDFDPAPGSGSAEHRPQLGGSAY